MGKHDFATLNESLEFVVDEFIPMRRCYVINIRGPKDIANSNAATVQVVAEDTIYKNGEAGLTVNLPFDPLSGEFRRLVEFVGTDLDKCCDEYVWDGVLCFALRVGRNTLLAEKVLRFVLVNVYGYVNLAGFEYEVHDEGHIGR